MNVLPIATLLTTLTCLTTALPAASAAQATPAGSSPTTSAVLVPTRAYVSPNAPLLVSVNADSPVQLVLADFIGATVSRSPGVVNAGNVNGSAGNARSSAIDIRPIFPNRLASPGTYVLYAVRPDGDHLTEFVGTPLVIQVRADARRGAPPGPMIYRLQPLRYARLSTSAGDLTACFYYDTAPNTVRNIEDLISDGFYDGLEFFRTEKNFVIQTGDPRNNGTGGPGFFQDAEFSDRLHFRGVLSLSRLTDPSEAPGISPRTEFANSGGSQFFICTNNDTAQQLNRRYTAFGRLVDDTTVLDALASTPIEDGSRNFRPRNPPKIESARLVNVTANDNPYRRLRVVEGAGSSIGRDPATTLPSIGEVAPGTMSAPLLDTLPATRPAAPAVEVIP